MGPRHDHRTVEFIYDLPHLRRGTGSHLFNLLDRVLLISRIDPLRGVSGVKIPVERQSRHPLHHGNAVLLGRPGINRRFIDDDAAGSDHLAYRLTGLHQGGQVRSVVLVDRGGHCDHEDVTGTDLLQRGGAEKASPGNGRSARRMGYGILRNQHPLQHTRLHLQRGILAGHQFIHPALVDVKSYHRIPGGKQTGQRKSHISQPNDSNLVLHSQ